MWQGGALQEGALRVVPPCRTEPERVTARAASRSPRGAFWVELDDASRMLNRRCCSTNRRFASMSSPVREEPTPKSFVLLSARECLAAV